MDQEDKFIKNLFGMNKRTTIETGTFRNIKFHDKNLEEQFLQNQENEKIKNQKIFYSILFIAHLFSLEDLFSKNKNIEFYILYGIFILFSLIIFILNTMMGYRKLQIYSEPIQIFLYDVLLNIKKILVVIRKRNLHQGNSEENEVILIILNYIYFNMIGTSVLLIISGNMFIFCFFMFVVLNLGINLVCHLTLNEAKNNHFILFSALNEILIYIISFYFKKICEIKLREIFLERYKFENLFLYAKDFIFGLNGYQLNFKNNYLLCYDKKFYKFLNENLISDKDIELFYDSFKMNKSLENKSRKKDTFILDMEKISRVNNLRTAKGLYLNHNHRTNRSFNIDNNNYDNYSFHEVNKFDLREFNPISYFLKELKKYDVQDKSIDNITNKEIKENSKKFFKHINVKQLQNNKNNDCNNNSNNNSNQLEQNYPHESVNNKNNTNKRSGNNHYNYEKNKCEINLYDQINLFFNDESIFPSKYENIYLGVFAFEPEKNKPNSFETIMQSLKNKIKTEKKIDSSANENHRKYKIQINSENCNLYNNNFSSIDLLVNKNNNISTNNLDNINVYHNPKNKKMNELFLQQDNILKHDSSKNMEDVNKNQSYRILCKNNFSIINNQPNYASGSLDLQNIDCVKYSNKNILYNNKRDVESLRDDYTDHQEKKPNLNDVINSYNDQYNSNSLLDINNKDVSSQAKENEKKGDVNNVNDEFLKSFCEVKNTLLRINNSKFDKKQTVYFDVYFRRIYFSEDNIVYNIIFYDVTDLISTKIKIEEENKIKQKLFAKIAHEFKTPLTSIICLISILKENLESLSSTHNSNKSYSNNLLNDDIKSSFDLIQNLSRYVIFLTSDIINYSHMDRINNLKFENHKIDFKEISHFCFDILRSLLYCNTTKLRKIDAQLIYNEELDNINFLSDQGRIKQILLNFISNAVKFTNEGYIKLIFEINLQTNRIFISIKDSGVGIKEEDQKNLFTEFFKTENTKINNLSNANIGSGLGLAICKNIAEKLNMKIVIDSQYKAGTEIYLILFLTDKNVNLGLDSTKTNSLKTNKNHSISRKILHHPVSEIESRNIILKESSLANTLKPSPNKYLLGSFESKKSKLELHSSFKTTKQIRRASQPFNISFIETYLEEMNSYKFDLYNKKEMEYFNTRTKIKNISGNIANTDIKLKHSIIKKPVFSNINYPYKDVTKSDNKMSLFKKMDTPNQKDLKIGKIDSLSDDDNSTIINDPQKLINDKLNFKSIKKLLNQNNKSKQLLSSFYLLNSFSNSNISISENLNNSNNELIEKRIILLADDNHIINESHKRLLKSLCTHKNLDYEIITCYDGMDILKIVCDEKFFDFIDLIITDENMEFINGSEAIKIIRIIEERKKSSKRMIVSLTCQEEPSILEHIKDSGADIILSKPLTKQKLINIFEVMN